MNQPNENPLIDRIETLEGATVQHGRSNNRIYLMKMGSADPKKLIRAMEELCAKKNYGKIFAKVPEGKATPFLDAGFEEEARIPAFFQGSESALFLARFFRRCPGTRSQ